MNHAMFTGVITGEDEKRFNTMLTFLGESYKVRTTRIGSGSLKYSIEVEEVGTSTIYKIDARNIEQLCASVVDHIVKDRVGRAHAVDDPGIVTGPFSATASGSSTGSMMMTKEMLAEIEKMMTKSFPSFSGPNKTINELRKELGMKEIKK